MFVWYLNRMQGLQSQVFHISTLQTNGISQVERKALPRKSDHACHRPLQFEIGPRLLPSKLLFHFP
jgi:hypothetical protein